MLFLWAGVKRAKAFNLDPHIPPMPPETVEPKFPSQWRTCYHTLACIWFLPPSPLPVEGLVLGEFSFGPIGQQVNAKFHFLLGVNPHGFLPWGNIGLEHSDMFSSSTCLVSWQPWERKVSQIIAGSSQWKLVSYPCTREAAGAKYQRYSILIIV